MSIEPDGPEGRVGAQQDDLVRFAPVAHRPWSTVLLIGHVLAAALCAVMVGLAIAVIVSDNSTHTDKWDGLAAGIATVVGGVVLLIGAAAVVFVILTRNGRRRADDGDPRTLQSVADTDRALGTMVAVLTLALLLAGGIRPSAATLVLVAVTGVWALVAHLTLRRMSSPRVVPLSDGH